MRTVDGVEPAGRSRVTDVVLACQSCAWGEDENGDARTAGTPGAGIAAVRRHVASTGHVAGVSITRLHMYRRQS